MRRFGATQTYSTKVPSLPGWNNFGQLGDGSKSGKTRFFQVISSGGKNVAAGDMHNMVLKQYGSVWTTGRNYNGQLGDGLKIDRINFVKVMSSGAMDVAAREVITAW